uniref:Uncharacterized protein n=1 Tax=Lygus hesperus TaxID=30085 RepID=A0A0A9X775_LYGHE
MVTQKVTARVNQNVTNRTRRTMTQQMLCMTRMCSRTARMRFKLEKYKKHSHRHTRSKVREKKKLQMRRRKQYLVSVVALLQQQARMLINARNNKPDLKLHCVVNLLFVNWQHFNIFSSHLCVFVKYCACVSHAVLFIPFFFF